MSVEIVKYYTVGMVKSNPEKIYIFGDNLEHWGKKGQAVIRDCENTIGIPTKRKPSMRSDAFFADRPDEVTAVVDALNLIRDKLLSGHTIVLPEDGIGTGLAQMKERSPILFEKMTKYLQDICPEYLSS